jgi:CheY-like chemotaxis protein/nitrogen-specific signal transduction histidine kinase
MISFAFSLLEKTKDLPSGINLLLSRIGKQYKLDRVSVTEVDLDYLSMRYIYQWSVKSGFSNIGNTYFLTKEFCSSFDNMNDEVTICDKADEFHLKSCLQSPIYEKGIYKGSVCFEKNVEGYIWSEDIKRLLKEISKVISTYTLKIKADSVSRAKTDFLSRMSHEIRTPMNAITGMASIAKSAIEDRNKVEDCLSKIEYSTKYLISLVNNILDMSKIESGKMTILNQSFDLKKLVQEIDIIMRAQTDAKNIHFVIVENYENNILLGDELRLSQVLVNILGNAVKFTEEYGEILFKVEQLEQVSNYAVIHFSVKDSGIGISNENINRIFNSFEQAESNIVKEYGGTGLGLSISSNLVRHMGGTLDVKSTYREGSEFFFTIRFELGNVNDITDKNELMEDKEKFDFKGKRVLVVEDNSLNMEIEKTLLEMAGCIVEEAKNGREAVDRFEVNPANYYDLILMDIRMPVMDGLEATKLIRTSEKEDARTVPIIATTANAFDEDTKKSMDSGMDGHISKPIEVKHLYEMVNKTIKSRIR